VAFFVNVFIKNLYEWTSFTNMRKILQKAKILIVDDFSDFRLSIKSMLVHLGAEQVDQASSGEDSIKLCQQNHYNIILCDYNLGEGQDGQQVLEELHQRKIMKQGTLFIMVTAETSAAKVISAIEYQPDTYLTKPFTSEQLSKRLQRLLYKNAALDKLYQLINKKKFPQALKIASEIIEEFPNVKYACLRIKAEIYEEMEELESALKIYEAVVEEQLLLWAIVGVGRIKYKNQEFTESLQHFEDARRNFPDQVSLIDWIAKCMLAKGQKQEAEDEIKSALKISPKSVKRQSDMGEVATSLEHFDIAQKAYGKAIKEGRHSCLLKPAHFSHYFDNTAKLIQQKPGKSHIRIITQAEEQAKHMEYLMQKNPAGLARNQASLANLFNVGGMKEKAIRYLKRLNKTLSKPGCNLESEDFSYIQDVMEPLSQNPFYKNFTKDINSTMDLKPAERKADVDETSPHIIKARQFNKEGMVLIQENKPLEGLIKFRKAIEINPENMSYVLNAAQSILENNILKNDANLMSEAKSYIETTQALSEDDPRIEKHTRLKELLN